MAQKLMILLLLGLGCCSLTAQPTNASFLHYTTDSGLSSDHITAIIKDKHGFLWVGTVNGLNRFDGHYFKVFRPDANDKKSLPGDHVIGITIAPDGFLWVATYKGLCRLDPDRLTIERLPLITGSDTLIDAVSSQVAFDSKGMAWTTSHNGIHKLNYLTGHQEEFIPAQPSLGWYGLYIDKQDRLWMLRDTLRRFDPQTKELRKYTSMDGSHDFIEAGAFCVAEGADGVLWAGTWFNGIWKYNATTDEFEREPLGETLAMMLLPDTFPNGEACLWVGGGQSGLGLYDPSAQTFLQFKPDPRDPYTHNNYLAKTMYKDRSGDVWIGTEVGLEQYAPLAIRFGRAMIPADDDMGQFSLVSGVVHDRNAPKGQRYYISMWGSGLFEWNKSKGTFNRMPRSKSELTGGGIFNLFQDRKGYIWGCLKGGSASFHPETNSWKDYRNFFKQNERNNLFWCGMEDRKGNLWFGSNREGLFRYNPQTDAMESFFFKEELAEKDGGFGILDISEDSSGRLWLACGSGLLVRFDPATGEFKRYAYAEQNIPLSCNGVEVGNNGRVYATFYGTFAEIDQDGKLLRHFNEQNGMRSGRTFFLVKDLQGKLWFTTEYLLHSFDPETATFNYYGKADGFFSNAMTDALSVTPSGEIFVGFQNAFNFFYPDRIRKNMQPPPVVITSIKVMNKERLLTGVDDSILSLKPGEDFFEVEFTALNYNQQERNRYAYLLEGFNKEWVYTDRPVATFTNLDGGEYLLRMKASNNDGVWNEQGTTLAIHVKPPFYQTRWFILLVAVVSGGIVTAFLWFRQLQRKHQERFRESLARDLHDEMGSALSSIRFFSDYANQQIGNEKPQVAPVLNRISESASNLSESMQDIIWAMKTKDDQLKDIATHMTEFGLRLCEARNINFKTNIAEDVSGKQLQPEVRRNTYLIFKEAVNNAAKYSAATEVDLEFAMKKGILLMKITDNGKGFEANSSIQQNIGNGLQNMRQRAAEIGGKLNIVSKAGEGTKVELQVKI